jgi:hypothetical protein
VEWIWKPWGWATASQGAALANARAAATELSRLRVEREDVELFLADRAARATAVATVRSDAVRRVGAG